ncbi:RNA 2',3'-cyclic phosphodiesterase, partial [Candidatus Woesearchaeota archaeon]|nr:RNA 2',3'-cyclic phosphodiesterase [Candidatus Woesearchaeota archaeon]
MRLFIAVDFNEQKDFLAGLQNQFNFLDTRLSFTKVFHLTLKFLGEVQPNVADSVMQSLGAVKSRPFTLNLGRIGIFPDSSHMRVVWIGISPEEPVLMLQKAVDESLSSLFKKEKNFKPHITLARVKSV